MRMKIKNPIKIISSNISSSKSIPVVGSIMDLSPLLVTMETRKYPNNENQCPETNTYQENSKELVS
jgi:hypothetical protein